MRPFLALAVTTLLFGCATAASTGGNNGGSAGSAGSGGAGGTGGTGGAGGAGGGSGGSGLVGPCVSAGDCAGLTDECNTGTCINGACEKLPANDGAACDDGKQCTVADSCQGGVCSSGNLKFCPSADTCHLGFCDALSDTCVQTPGNDGASCDDGDACTGDGTCSAGVCFGGGQIDCSFLNGSCSVGMCDAALGCVALPQNDGTPCDDGLFCTISDACQAGACTGQPNTCAAPGDVCMIGSCNEALDQCAAVPGNNGAACSDGNDCTVGETCNAGQCLGGLPGNNGAACDDGDGCTSGTTCANGACGNPGGVINQCLNGDGCCPGGCPNNADDDCMDLTGVFAQYPSEGRDVYIWKTPPCANLTLYTTFCQDHGLVWWSPKSAADAQQLITFAYNLDSWHTWIQVYGSTTTDVNGQVGAYNVTVDGSGCVDGSNGGWTAFRKWACSFCEPENNSNASCCWDIDHLYDWFVCEG